MAYVIGGGASTSVEAAAVDDTGMLGAFVAGTSSLRVDRRFAGLAVGRDHVFVVGGQSTSDLASVEDASLAADASLDPFEMAGGLTTPRAHAGYVALGPRLCAVGGDSTAAAGGELATIECAEVQSDGTLGMFADAGVRLVTPRSGAALAVVGAWLYAVGGDDGSGPLKSVEKAPIMPDGTLGAFAADNTALTTARFGAGAIVLGQTLHIIGGWTGAVYASTVDAAPIMADGSLMPFATTSSTLARLQGPSFGVLRSWVYLIGPQMNLRANISGDTFGDFAGAGGTPLGVDVATASAGDWLYATGGAPPGNPANVYAWHMTSAGLGNLAQVGSLNAPRSAAGAIVLGEWLYILGGLAGDGTTVLASIERARLR
jgi:hypothetical protein